MYILKKTGLLLAIHVFFCASTMFAQSNYVKKFRPIADSLAHKFGIPAAVILGVATLESGCGKSRNAKLLHNHFGMIGKNNWHEPNGKRSVYKLYDKPESSYIEFANHLTRRKFYHRLKGNMDYRLWVDAISKDNYSEIPLIWKTRVLKTIEKNHLSPTN